MANPTQLDPERLIKVLAKHRVDFVLIGVEDQGIGIPADHLAKVFEKFHRVHNEDNRKIYGTGLGLFVTRATVEQLGGTLTLRSEPGRGTTATIALPRDVVTGGRSSDD